MKFYLSSYGIGNEVEKFKELIPNKKVGYISNARDFTGADPEKRKIKIAREVSELRELDLKVEEIDLKNYFNKKDELRNKINELGAIFISGGNVFVLRQAMRISGLDNILQEFKNSNNNFLYAGYSAAGCVLAPSLSGMDIVDPLDTPYIEQKEIIWEGLNLVNFHFCPHYKSDHPESADVDKEVEFCQKNNILYKTVRDGEVIIIE